MFGVLGLIATIIVGLCLLTLFAIAVGKCIAFGLDDDYDEQPPATIHPIGMARARRDREPAA